MKVRALFAVGLAASFVVAGCGSTPTATPASSAGSNSSGSAQSQPANQKMEKVDVQIAWLMNSQSAALAAAVQEGLYKKHGLDVTLHAGGPNIDPINNVVSGHMQFGVANSSGSLMLARAQGVPVKAIGALYQKHPFSFFYDPASGITKPQDLKGKNIGIQSTSRYLLDAWLKKNGMTESDVKITTVGSDLVPLAQKQVDAISGWNVNAGQMAAVPTAKYFMVFDAGIKYYANVIFTTDKEIKEKPDIVKQFMAATMEGLQFAIQNPDQATKDVVASAPNMDAAVEGKTLQLSIPEFASDGTKANGLGYMDKQVWDEGQQILVDTQQMKTPVNVDDLFTNDFITNNTPKL